MAPPQLDVMVPLAAALVFVAAWALLILQIDPVPTWFYVFTWYPILIIANDLAGRAGTRGGLFDSVPRTVSLFGWSAIIWLVFEALNFRLQNWYYVFLPSHTLERWVGILLSFGTVVPAIMLAERLLATAGVARTASTTPLRSTPAQLRLIQLLGVGMVALALSFPRTFFPLVWGAALLIADPIVLRRRPEASLFGDLATGFWGRIVRLMLAGLAVGLVWEFLNFWARGKWIYTVPWLEHTKLFEMPPLGFLGFPFFALEAWAVYHMVSGGRGGRRGRGGRTTERQGGRAADHGPPSPSIASYHLGGETGSGDTAKRQGGNRVLVIPAAALFAILVLVGMERWTISSVTPRLVDLPGMSPAAVSSLAAAGVASPFVLTRAHRDSLAGKTAISRDDAWHAVETARLVTLRGIGTVHATRLATLDIRTTCQLARRLPGTLWRAYHEAPRLRRDRLPGPRRPTPAEVQVWIGAARRACTERYTSHRD